MGRLFNMLRAISELKLSLKFGKIRKEINAVLNEPSLYADMPRKSYKQRKKENILWYLKNGEANIYYNSYGFDIVGFRNQSDYMPYRKFRMERNNEDFNVSVSRIYRNRVCILRDKTLFSAFISKVLGKKYVPEDIGLIYPDGRIYDYNKNENTDFKTICDSYSGDLFIKKLDGECGDGCYLIKENDLSYFESIKEKMKGSSYLIQKRVMQHEDVNKINPSCINTIRIITIISKSKKKPQIFAKYMRVGMNAINDNRATGGVGVYIDDDGKMGKTGVGHHVVIAQHPFTSLVFEDYQIPFWKEANELVLSAHSFLPDIPTIGWDVAITPDGPILIEGNDNWEISGAQDTAGGLKKKWYELHK